ncbi:MAG: hypothetical protein A2Z21_06990 [Candidatus Fraserbacteria bacterium RBG_16_55_9]|uniref:DUF4911 domain-containing protein n=1 Tax=Fraserbacteria sp. (strain RBG_16_55_9) TaxID=1817864 RepID=A0A1F5UQD8_FRAXR|nr:MAG: hypothetical protein A2Z21_06990 [Candidatus Fraserbacteria bacterium RBG_16_55_9]
MKNPVEPPEDTVALFVEMNEKDVHFLEMIIIAYDGVAHLRRDWFERDGRRFFKILVSPDLVDELRRILDNTKKYIQIGEIRTSL